MVECHRASSITFCKVLSFVHLHSLQALEVTQATNVNKYIFIYLFLIFILPKIPSVFYYYENLTFPHPSQREKGNMPS